MKKYSIMAARLLSLCMILITLLTIAPTAFAIGNISATTTSTSNQITPKIDETEWVFRTYNGLFQKRLWSYTEGKWLTDWITVGTVIE